MTTDDQTAALDRRTFLRAAGALAAGGALVAGIGTFVATRPGPADRLVAHRREGTLPVDRPDGDVWTDIDPFPVPLLMQQITQPQPLELAVREIRVRAMHNDTELAFHLEWNDVAVDDTDAMARFRDAVAVQLPVAVEADPAAPLTSVTMGLAPVAGTGGQPGTPGQVVHILHWKASWQYDVDHGRRTVKDIFPNMYNDVTPEGILGGEANAISFYPGVFAGNSMSARERRSPVEELIATGFGSLTTHEQQQATGKGVHEDGQWRVVIALPMSSGDPTKATLSVGTSVPVAFAVWAGQKQNRGARKQYANWVPMEIEGA